MAREEIIGAGNGVTCVSYFHLEVLENTRETVSRCDI